MRFTRLIFRNKVVLSLWACAVLGMGLVASGCQLSPPAGESASQREQAASNVSNERTGAGDAGYWRYEAEAHGEEIYRQNCATCHGFEGEGAQGFFPALRNNALVNGPYALLVIVPMYGRGAMPSYSSLLTDEEIALVLTYIRSAWGNDAGAISPSQIAPFRQPGIDVPLEPILGGAA
jgi:mono/diheme cytochrome c family protein